jgi:ADP-heptose:LPS heptosyltransferase
MRSRCFNSSTIRSILVFSNEELIGDGLVKLPFVASLKACFPHAEITWMTRRSCIYQSALLEIARPYIDHIVEYTHLGSSWHHAIWHRYCHESYDLIINTEPRLLRMLAARRIPHNYFYSSYRDFLLSDIKPSFPKLENPDHVLNQLMWHLSNIVGSPVSITKPIIEIPKIYMGWATEQLSSNNVRYIGLAPGSGGRNKCWPLDCYIELAKQLLTLKHHPVFLIGPQELEWVSILKEAVPQALFPLQNVCGDLSVYHTFALSQRLCLGVANDAGPSHLMATANIPLIVLYGPTTPTHFIPNTDHFQALTINDCGVNDISKIDVSFVCQKILEILDHRLHE